MYIDYSVVHGIEYARVCESYRDGKTIRKRTVLYLGRVIDREKGIFRNRELGLISSIRHPEPSPEFPRTVFRRRRPEKFPRETQSAGALLWRCLPGGRVYPGVRV